MNLLDTRFAGMAVGVGSSRILGRIHIAQSSDSFDEGFSIVSANA